MYNIFSCKLLTMKCYSTHRVGISNAVLSGLERQEEEGVLKIKSKNHSEDCVTSIIEESLRACFMYNIEVHIDCGPMSLSLEETVQISTCNVSLSRFITCMKSELKCRRVCN